MPEGDEEEDPPFDCPLGHDYHNTEDDEGEFCPEGMCASDRNDTEWVKCGYIFFTGSTNGEGYALWSDYDHITTANGPDPESGTWRVCEECHYNLILAGLDGHAHTPRSEHAL